MTNWNKKQVPGSALKEYSEKFGIDPLTASILYRRGLTEGADILYFLENDKRFLHNPFLFSSMEDAVDRIYQAQEEGEIVLIFGDKDIDGISSTTILYEQLVSMGMDVSYRLPGGNDGYGLSIEAVDDFYSKNGTLIITVDCGISNNTEIAHAAELGIDVIVIDHHNPPESLPQPAVIVNPKCIDSGYPFKDISGAAVTFKVVEALRFAKTNLYKQEFCLLTVVPGNNEYTVQCQKVHNLVKTKYMEETLSTLSKPFSHTKLSSFLQGQSIYVWDGNSTSRLLQDLFGKGVEFNFADARELVSKVFPQQKNADLKKIKNDSVIAKYFPETATEIGAFFNIFISWIHAQLSVNYPENKVLMEKDMQLVALAALGDVMPLINENRIFLKLGVNAMNERKLRPGLQELFPILKNMTGPVNSIKLSWNVVPVLNATGRLGQPELALQLFLEKDPAKRKALALKIQEMNETRKKLGNDAIFIGQKHSDQSFKEYEGKLCVVIDEEIYRGVAGTLAAKLVEQYKVPSMAVTFVGDVAVGSMRSCRGFAIPPFLDKMADLFLNHGGHNQAAGFSLEKSRLPEFQQRLKSLLPEIKLDDIPEQEIIDIDAEIPKTHMSPDLLKIVDLFEPYGEGNPELMFMSRDLQILDGVTLGKPEPVHLKLVLNANTTKWPAMYFNHAEKYHQEFDKGDILDVRYTIQRNVFNGMETPQMILKETVKK